MASEHKGIPGDRYRTSDQYDQEDRESVKVRTQSDKHGVGPEDAPLWKKLRDALDKGYTVEVVWAWAGKKGGTAWHTGRVTKISTDITLEGFSASFRMDGSGWVLMDNVVSIKRVDRVEPPDMTLQAEMICEPGTPDRIREAMIRGASGCLPTNAEALRWSPAISSVKYMQSELEKLWRKAHK